MNESEDLLLAALSRLSERELTLRVLMPLFAKLGYQTPSYHGGPYEEGKDVVLWKRNAFGTPELCVVQVKLLNASAAVSSSQSFSGIVHQLEQAVDRVDQHYRSRLPDKSAAVPGTASEANAVPVSRSFAVVRQRLDRTRLSERRRRPT